MTSSAVEIMQHRGMRKKRESLSAMPVKQKQEQRLDKTQGIQDSDYRVNSTAVKPPIATASAVPLDVFDYEQLEKVEFLASGAFSHVFSAKYQGKQVVVKLLREQYKDSHVTLKQMRFEQVLLSQLHHPNIVEFLGTGVYNGVPFTVLERLDETLNQRIGGEIRLTMMEALSYAKAVGEALIYIHDQAVPGQVTLHRDLKPDNLAFDDDGEIKLIDFGLARSIPKGTSIDEVYEMTGETGSLRYMAPEVALGMLYNAKADVYSLSLITWQMVQGTKPFQGMSRKDFFHHVVHRHFRPPIDPRWPSALSNLILRSWDPDHLKRPTARDYVFTIDSIMNSLNRHRRNSTGNSSSLGRMRTMFQMMKERAEDYVIGTGGKRSSLVEVQEDRPSNAHRQDGPTEAFVNPTNTDPVLQQAAAGQMQPQMQKMAQQRVAQQQQLQPQEPQSQPQPQQAQTANPPKAASSVAVRPQLGPTANVAVPTGPVLNQAAPAVHPPQPYRLRAQPSPSVDLGTRKFMLASGEASKLVMQEGATGAGAPHKRRNSY